MSNNRFYSFRVVTYNTDLSLISSFCSLANKYAYILHNRDKTDPHYHILITFSTNKSFSTVRSLMGGCQNTFVQPMTDKYKDFEYLIHSEDFPDKALYNSSDIVTNDLKFFIRPDKKVEADEFINDILPSSMLTYRELALKYGRDYIRHYRDYSAYGCLIEKQEEHINLGYDPDKISLLSIRDWHIAFSRYLSDYYYSNFSPDIALKLLDNSQLEIYVIP